MSVLVKIRVDDQGNAKIIDLHKNIGTLKNKAETLGPVLEKVFAGAGLLYGLDKLRDGVFAATQEIGKFELGIKRIEGIGGVTGGALKQMGGFARELATETEFSASKITEAMLEMVKQGFQDPVDLMQATPKILDLSTASMMELNYAAENTINIMREFSMANNEAGRVANGMATVLNKTGANAEDFMEAMKYAGAVAHGTGVEFEETAALLGVLADAGIKGSMAGTTLRTIFLNLLKPNEAVKEGLKKIGTEGKNLSEIFTALEKSGLTIVDFLETFDKRAITGSMILADENVAEKVRNLNFEMYQQLLTVKDVSTVIRAAMIPTLQRMVNNLNEVGLSIFDAFGDTPIKAIEHVIKQIKELDKWVDDNREKIAKLAEGFLKITEVMTTLSVEVLKVVIENIDTLTTLVLTLVGAHVLGKIPTLLDNIKDGFNKTSFFSGSLWSGLALKIQLVVTALGLVKIATDSIFDRIEEHKKSQETANLDFTVKGLSDRLSALDKLKKAQEEVANTESEAKNKLGPNLFKVDQSYREALKDREKAFKEYKSKYGDDIIGSTDGKDLAKTVDAIRQVTGALKQAKSPPVTFDELIIKPPKAPPSGKDLKNIGIFEHLNAKGTGSTEEDPFKSTASAIDKMYKDADTGGFVDREMSRMEKEEERLKALTDKVQEVMEHSKQVIEESSWSMGESVLSIYETISVRKYEKLIEGLEREKAAIEQRFDAEISAAGSNAFKREMLEQRKAKAVIENEKKIERARKEMLKRQKLADNMQATANMFKAVIGTMAETKGGLLTRTASGLAMGAIMAGYLTQLTAINYREGSKGLIDGPGNSTSDSVLAWVSRGERLLSKKELDSVGGNERLQQVIDRGSTYNKNDSLTLIVQGNIIGQKQYVRNELLPEIKRELRR